jgi:hypothetical protein
MAQERPDSVRPTSRTHLTLARVAALATSCAAAFAVGLGISSDAFASGGGYIALPFVAAAVVALLLTAGWHVTLGYAAHTREVHERAIGFGFGVALFLIGVGCSGWFLASMLGGNAALQAQQHDYLDRLTAAMNVAAANAASERNIVSALDSAAGNLDKTANAEGSNGIVSGRVGQKVVYTALKNAAASMASMRAALGAKGEERDELLARARDAIREALRASASHDAALFQESTANAASAIAAANAIRFAPALAGLGNGLATNQARAVIDESVNNVHSAALVISKQRRTVDIPVYEPIDAKHAILSHPQPLAWVVAIVIEILPLVMLGLLLALWRDDEQDSNVEALQDFERARPRILPVPAE